MDVAVGVVVCVGEGVRDGVEVGIGVSVFESVGLGLFVGVLIMLCGKQAGRNKPITPIISSTFTKLIFMAY